MGAPAVVVEHVTAHVQSGVTLTCPLAFAHATLTVTDPLAGTVYVMSIGSPPGVDTTRVAPSQIPPLMPHDELVPAVATASMMYSAVDGPVESSNASLAKQGTFELQSKVFIGIVLWSWNLTESDGDSTTATVMIVSPFVMARLHGNISGSP